MTELHEKRCEACQAGAARVEDDQIPTLMKQLDGWSLIHENGVQQLSKLYKFKNFKDAWAFTDRLAALAEEEGHHPAILLEWGKVKVNWWSHSIKGLHLNDFIMAAMTDKAL